MSPPVCLASVSPTAIIFCSFSLVLKFVFLKQWPESHTTCNLEMFCVVNCTLLSVKAFMCQVAKQECHERRWSSPLQKEKLGRNLLMCNAENKRDADMNMPINFIIWRFSNDRGTFVSLCCHSAIVPEDAVFSRSESHSCSMNMLRIGL